MEAMEALLGRVSSVALTDPGPNQDELKQILSAAIRAPDHGRMRPWRFIIVRGAARERLGSLFAEALRRRNGSISAGDLQAERNKTLRAPLIIVVAATIRTHPKVPSVEQILAAGAAAQNIMLAAHALGFGGMWRTGSHAYDPELKQALGLSADDAIIGFLYVGTSAKAPHKRALEDPTTVVRELGNE